MWKHMKTETHFVDLTNLFIKRCPEHFWTSYSPTSKADTEILDAIMSKKNVFCYSVQNTGRFNQNQALIRSRSNIKILTSTPELFSAPVYQERKGVALLMRGISYGTYQHFSKSHYTIDFRDNFENVDAMLIQPLKQRGVDVDLFCVTYDQPYLHTLKELYKPGAVVSEPFDSTRNNYVMHMMSRCLELVLAQAKQYQLVIMTRFDINLMLSILDIPYKDDKINFTCKTADGGVDDTLIIFNGSYLDTMFQVVSNNIVYDYQHRLHKTLDQNDIHYMSDTIYGSITTKRPYVVFNRELHNSLKNSFCINTMLWQVIYKTDGALMKGCDKSGVWAFMKRPGIITPQGFSISTSQNADVSITFDISFLTVAPATVLLNETAIALSECERGVFVRLNATVRTGEAGSVVWSFSGYSPEIHLHIKNIRVGNEYVIQSHR